MSFKYHIIMNFNLKQFELEFMNIIVSCMNAKIQHK